MADDAGSEQDQEVSDTFTVCTTPVAAQFAGELGHWLPRDRCDGTAAFLCAVLQGMAIQSGDGATVDDLRTIAATARSCAAR